MASFNASIGSDALEGSDPIDLGSVDVQTMLDSGDLELVGQSGPVVVQQQEVHNQVEEVVPSVPVERNTRDSGVFAAMRSKVLAGATAAGMLVGVAGGSSVQKAEAGDTVVAAAKTTTEGAPEPTRKIYNPLNARFTKNSPEVEMIKKRIPDGIQSDEALVLWLNTYGDRYENETLDEYRKREESVTRIREVESKLGTSSTYILISKFDYLRSKSTGKIYKVNHYYLTTTNYRIRHNEENIGGGVFLTMDLGYSLEKAIQAMNEEIDGEILPANLAKKGS